MLDIQIILILIIAGIANIGLAVFGTIKTKKSNYLRPYFMVFAYSTCAWLVWNSAYLINSMFWLKLVYSLGILTISSATVFVFAIAKDRGLSYREIAVISVIGLALVLMCFKEGIFFKGEVTPAYAENYAAYFPIYMAFLLGSIVLWLYKLVRSLRRFTGFKRQQAKYVISGIALFGSTPLVFSVFLPAIGIVDYTMLDTIGSIFFMGFTTYAIIRFRLMDITVVLTRAAVFLVCYVPMLAIPFYVGYRTGSWQWTGWSMFFFATIGPVVYKLLQRKIEDLIMIEQKTYSRIIKDVTEKMGREFSLDSLVKMIVDATKTSINIEYSAMYLEDKEKKAYVLRYFNESIDMKLMREVGYHNELVKYMEGKDKAVLNEELPEEIRHGLGMKFGVLLPVPTVSGNNLAGMILLGDKLNKKHYSDEDMKVLDMFLKQVSSALDNILLHDEMGEKARMEEELRVGREIQKSLLPHKVPEAEGLALTGLMVPAKEIGGDYYDFIRREDDREMGIVIGDVSGKGVGSGLIMAAVKSAMYLLHRRGTGTKEALISINGLLYEYSSGSKMMTMLYMKWDPKKKELVYTNGGHEYILLSRKDKEIEIIKGGGVMLGVKPEVDKLLEEKRLALSIGDKVMLYTDGAIEARNERNEFYEISRLTESMKKHSSKSIEGMIQSVKEDIYAFIGSRQQTDDITLVGLEVE